MSIGPPTEGWTRVTAYTIAEWRARAEAEARAQRLAAHLQVDAMFDRLDQERTAQLDRLEAQLRGEREQ